MFDKVSFAMSIYLSILHYHDCIDIYGIYQVEIV